MKRRNEHNYSLRLGKALSSICNEYDDILYCTSWCVLMVNVLRSYGVKEISRRFSPRITLSGDCCHFDLCKKANISEDDSHWFFLIVLIGNIRQYYCESVKGRILNCEKTWKYHKDQSPSSRVYRCCNSRMRRNEGEWSHTVKRNQENSDSIGSLIGKLLDISILLKI